MEPLNLVLSAQSTVTPADLLAALGQSRDLDDDWSSVGIGVNPFAGNCMSEEDADVDSGYVAQSDWPNNG